MPVFFYSFILLRQDVRRKDAFSGTFRYFSGKRYKSHPDRNQTGPGVTCDISNLNCSMSGSCIYTSSPLLEITF